MTDFSPENRTASGGPAPFAPNGNPTPPNGIAHAGGATHANGPARANGDEPAPVGPALAAPAAPAVPVAPAPARPTAVKGRIEVADEVVEKVAALAAIEVEGVADLGGDFERALESVRERIGIGQKRGDQGVKARITGREVAVDVVILVEYGHVVMDVARNVQANVAVQTNRMLGLSVVEVNVVVDDVKLPTPTRDRPDDSPYLPLPADASS